MGTGPEDLRPSVAEISVRFAAASLVLVAAAALLVFSGEEHREGWRAIAFAIVLGFVGWTALARLLWIEFVVLA